MFEFATRLVVAAALAGVSWAFESPPFPLGWRLALAVASYGALAYLLERRGLRSLSASTLVALADSAAIAVVAAATGQIERFGFLVLAPSALAVARHRAQPAALAPIAASLLVASSFAVLRQPPSPALLAQTASVLLIGLFLAQQGRDESLPELKASEVETFEPPSNAGTTNVLQLRESFRALRDHCLEIEKKSKRFRIESELLKVAHQGGEGLHTRLAAKVREMTAVQGLTLMAVSKAAGKMVVRASSGDSRFALETMAFDLAPGTMEGQARQRLATVLQPALANQPGTGSKSVFLKDRGRIVGAVCLIDRRSSRLEQAAETVEEAASVLAMLLQEDLQVESLARRLREAELLYALAAVGAGADSPTALAARAVRESWHVHDLDHLAIQFIDGAAGIPIASQGASANLVDALRHPMGSGLPGWLASGAPDVVLFDATDDDRCDRKEALKRRVGSFCLLPIQFGPEPFGFLTAATHRIGGIDAPGVDSLRVLCAELAHAIARLEPSSGAEGLATPREFQKALAEAGDGCLVYLEPLRRDELVEEFGQPAFELAIQQLARRLRVTLPAGGLLCWRAEGDYVAFLRDCEEPFARSWANEAAATAAMVALRTPDGRARIPLALKARVAEKGKHSHQIRAESVS